MSESNSAEPLAITVATLLTDRKFYANQIFFRSILNQTLVSSGDVRLVLVIDDLSPECAAEARAFAAKHASRFPRGIEIIQSYPLFTGGFNWSSGRHGLLRQQAMDRYLSLPADLGLVWWDADQDWSSDFLEICATCGHPVASGIYLLRHSRNVALFQHGVPWHLPDEKVAAGGPAIMGGLGGTWVSHQTLQLFSQHGGWMKFGRDKDGLALTEYQAEDAFFFVSIGLPVPVFTVPWCWHWEGDERDGERTPRYAQAARVENGNLSRYRISDGGVVRPFGTEPRRGERPFLSVCTLVHDTRADACILFLDGLSAQDYPKNRINVLIGIDSGSPVCSFIINRWKTSAEAKEYASVTVWESPSPPRGALSDSQWWTNRIAHLRQEALEKYLVTPKDEGLLWWDADTVWDSDFISKVIACGWPLVQGIYASRGQKFPCVLRYDISSKSIEVIHTWNLSHNYTNNYATFGGFFANREFWAEFSDRGGWKDYTFIDGVGEDGFPLLTLGRETYVLPSVGAWHIQGDGTATRIQAEAHGQYVSVLRTADGTIVQESEDVSDRRRSSCSHPLV